MALRAGSFQSIPLVFDAFDVTPVLLPLFQRQRRPRWCWAACASMLLDALAGKTAKSQCALAASQATDTVPKCCGLTPLACQEGSTGAAMHHCDVARTFLQIDQLFRNEGIQFTRVEGRLSESELETEINTNRRPVQIWLDATTAVLQHVALVVGATRIDGELVLALADPCDTGTQTAAYAELLDMRGGWIRTWKDLR
jgi:hypothetical protein